MRSSLHFDHMAGLDNYLAAEGITTQLPSMEYKSRHHIKRFFPIITRQIWNRNQAVAVVKPVFVFLKNL